MTEQEGRNSNKFFVDLARLAEKPPTIKEAADQFDQLVKASKAYSWIAVINYNDPYGRNVADVYLAERQIDNLPPENVETMLDAIDAFDTLSLVLEPQVDTNLHLVKDGEVTLDVIKQRLSNKSLPGSLVFEEVI